MVRVSEYADARFEQKLFVTPPVEIGEHVINSFGKLAAIAAMGHGADSTTIDRLSQEADHTLEMLYESGGAKGLPQYLTNVASRDEPPLYTPDTHTFFSH
ncbi:hypothetical protein EPN95_02620 [Patescibacteria group bacterium]|nr:MAG: hypothetical protein EPN95_02620 [Patescibacteria group bacterium]